MLERVQSTEAVKKAIEEERKTADRYDDIEETLNLPYMNREETPLAMDIFKPVTEDIRELPVIVTIHGGGLVIGDRRLSRPFARELAHKGYLVFSIEFRLAPRANVCQQLDDICAGLDCVGRHLVDYDVDFDRLFLAADSSGAYLAMYAAAMKHSEKLQKVIGYEPTRFVFRALCLSTGMLYTNLNDPCGWLLSEQIYGEKMMDKVFLKYMNPEHPEIINNLPPTIFMTSRGDFLNHYSIMMNEAMKKAGKESRLIYYPDEDLMHAFQTMQTEHPKAKESIDKMLTWFEEQAVIGIERRKEDPAIEKTRRSINRRISRGTITKQPVWKCLREYHSFDPARMRATALIDCTREYSFEQFFEECERYARVFSALHMSGSDGSRVGIGSTITAEPIFAFYGLNMTGATVSMLSYPDFLPTGQWKEMVEQEKITDLILSDFIVTPDLMRDIEHNRERLGIKHVIFLHSRLGGPCTGPAEMIFNEFNYHALKRRPRTVFIDDLLVKYESYPITYAKEDPDHIAVITHTSGTTKGTRKPLPYTDRAVNTVACSTVAQSIPKSYEHIPTVRVAPCFDFSSFMCICGLVNAHLAAAHTIVLTFFGFIHPKYIRGLEYYGVNIVFASGFMIDKWMERPDLDDVDLSAVKIFACGGSYVSPEKYRKYKNFLREHNCESDVLRGYGMSESGAAELSVPENCEEDIIGYPKPKENFRIQDENDGLFYEVDDGERTGVMYIASDSLCLNTLDGKVLFEYTIIDGRPFICTNDLVRVNANGSFSYAGRADRFFVNNEGIRFDPGVVEVKISAHPAIARCAVVPVLEKRIHDTVPVLYVIPEIKGPGAEERVRRALIDVNPFSFMQNMGPFAGGQNMNPCAFMHNFMQNMGPCMSGQNQGAAGFYGPMQGMNPWANFQSFMQNMGQCMNGQNQGAAGFFGPMQNMNPWANFRTFMQNMGQCMNGQNKGPACFFGPMQNMNPWADFRSFMQNMGQCMTGQNKNPWSSMQEFMQNMGQCMTGQNEETSDTNKQELSGEGIQFNNMYLMPFMFFYMQMMFQMYCMMLISQMAYRNWQQMMNMQAGAFPFKMPFPTYRNSEANDQQEGFSFGGFKLSPSDLQKLLQMNVSPKSLETLQKILDTIFDAYSSSGK